MPNQIYAKPRYELLTGLFNWGTLSVIVTAWAGTPWFDETDETIMDLRAHGPLDVASSLPVVGMLATAGGYAASGAALIPTPPVGTISFLTIAEEQTPAELSKLILFLDTGYDLPYYSNGLDMLVQPDWLNKRGWFRP